MNAANCYEQLTLNYPDIEDYKVYFSQALYQACLYEEAMKVTVQIDNPEMAGQVRICKPKWNWIRYLALWPNFGLLAILFTCLEMVPLETNSLSAIATELKETNNEIHSWYLSVLSEKDFIECTRTRHF